MSKYKKLKVALAVLLALVLLDTWVYYFHTPERTRFVSESPDGRFTVSGHANFGIWVMPEGMHVRNPYLIVLREVKTGKVLRRERPEQWFAVDRSSVSWFLDYNEVGIVSQGVWDLPPAEAEKH